jgi:hypothetical protein
MEPSDPWMPPLGDDGALPEGPDYVALVIEWDDAIDEMGAVGLDEDLPPPLPQRQHRLRNIAIACGTAGLLALAAGWRWRHSHAAR